MKCSECKFKNEKDAQFCVSCGARLPRRRNKIFRYIFRVFLAIIGILVVGFIIMLIADPPKFRLNNEIAIRNYEELSTGHLPEEIKVEYEEVNRDVLMEVERWTERNIEKNDEVNDYSVYAGFTNSELAYHENAEPVNAGEMIRAFVNFDLFYRYYEGDISSRTLEEYADRDFYFSNSTFFTTRKYEGNEAYIEILDLLGGAEEVTENLHSYGFSDTIVGSDDFPTAIETANKTSVKDLQLLIYTGLVGNPQKNESFNKAAATFIDHYGSSLRYWHSDTQYPWLEEAGSRPQSHASIMIESHPEGDFVFIFLGDITSETVLTNNLELLPRVSRRLNNKKELTEEVARINSNQSSLLLQTSLYNVDENLQNKGYAGIWERPVDGGGGMAHVHPLINQIRFEEKEYMYIQDNFIYTESVDGYDQFYLIMDVSQTSQPNELEIRYVNGFPNDLSIINYETATIKIDNMGDRDRLIFNKNNNDDIAYEYSEKLQSFEIKSKTNAFQNIRELNNIIYTNNTNEIVFSPDVRVKLVDFQRIRKFIFTKT